MIWKPLETLPKSGKYLIAKYAPTNWAYYVLSVMFYEEDTERAREIKLQWARAWAEMPEEPNFR